MLKTEFHSHTNYIQKIETKHSPKQLIGRAASLGYDVLSISEHYILTWFGESLKEYRKYPFSTYEDFKDYASSKGILLLRSVEVWYPEGEVLLINFQGNVKDYPTLKSLNKLPKTVLVIAPHPYFKREICLGDNLVKNIGLFDAIEYSNFYLTKFNLNKKAELIAKKYDKALVGTSDVHHLMQMGYTYTLVDADKNPESIVKAVKDGKVKLVTRQLPFFVFFWVTCSSFYKLFAIVPRTIYRKLLKK